MSPAAIWHWSGAIVCALIVYAILKSAWPDCPTVINELAGIEYETEIPAGGCGESGLQTFATTVGPFVAAVTGWFLGEMLGKHWTS